MRKMPRRSSSLGSSRGYGELGGEQDEFEPQGDLVLDQ